MKKINLRIELYSIVSNKFIKNHNDFKKKREKKLITGNNFWNTNFFKKFWSIDKKRIWQFKAINLKRIKIWLN